MFQLKSGDTIALVGNSNPQGNPTIVAELQQCLAPFELKIVASPLLLDTSWTNSEAKAQIMHQYFQDDEIQAIFDISGGDRANGVLSFLDFELIKQHPKTFFGYSDLSTVLNSLYTKTQLPVELFQLQTLLWDQTGEQIKKFRQTFFENNPTLYVNDWQFVQGTEMSGVVIGGNIRCFLKLAGTPYQPDFTDKILFLESLGGEEHEMFTALHQLKQQPNFLKIRGILLGTFTRYQKVVARPIEQLVQDVLQDENLPIAVTTQIGHGKTSNALTIGKFLEVRA